MYNIYINYKFNLQQNYIVLLTPMHLHFYYIYIWYDITPDIANATHSETYSNHVWKELIIERPQKIPTLTAVAEMKSSGPILWIALFVKSSIVAVDIFTCGICVRPCLLKTRTFARQPQGDRMRIIAIMFRVIWLVFPTLLETNLLCFNARCPESSF